MANVSSSNGLEKYPKLRFKDFSEPWKTDTLGNLGTFIKGAPLSKADITDEGTPFVLYGELYTTYGEVTHSIKRRTDKVVEPQFYSKVGDVIMPTSGETPEDIATASCIMLPDVILAGDLLIYRTQKVDGRLVSFVVKNKVNKQISSVAQGKSVVHVRAEELSKIAISYPSDAEQHKILTMLELLEDKMSKQRELIEHLKKYKRGAITLILSNKDASWKSGRLGDFITINRGGSPRPIEAFITNDPDGVNWIKIGDVSEDSLYITQTAEKITAEGSRKSRKVFAGDLILSNSMSFGRPYIMQIEGCIHDGWLLLRDDGACFDKKYLCYYLASDEVLAQYKKYAAGSCVSNLNSELVSNVFIEFPPLEKQKEIASSLELLDERINCEIKLLDKLLLIKKGLLQSLFI